MSVYISVDMEGIGGIGHPHPTDPTHARYPEAVALMVGMGFGLYVIFKKRNWL